MQLKNLKIDRALAVFDLETTGLDVQKDRIVEISVARFEPDGEVNQRTRRLNPTIPIHPGASETHHIYDHDVAAMPTFARVARSLYALLADCDLAGFNVKKFDLPILVAEFHRAGVSFDVDSRRVIDAQEIYHARERRNLAAAVRFYCGREHLGAHGALADVQAVADVIDGQLTRYPDLPRDIQGLHLAFHDPSFTDYTGKLRETPGGVEFAFGPHAGRTLAEVALSPDRHFLEWVLRKDFSPGVKELVLRALHEPLPAYSET